MSDENASHLNIDFSALIHQAARLACLLLVACSAPSTGPRLGDGGAAGSAQAGSGAASGSSGTAGSIAAAGGSGGSAGSAGSGGGGGVSFSCTPGDNLLTTGGFDDYDCLILELAAKYGHPDARILKSQIMQESSMQVFALSPDSPCGIMEGWSDAESKSFGLTQVTPACGEGAAFLLLDGHPNMTEDMASPFWETSVFNPDLNLDQGILEIGEMYALMKETYAGCTEIQYTLMAAGAYNSGPPTIHGCSDYEDRPTNYMNAVLGRYQTFAAEGGWPNPYPSSI